jgi:phenylacetic acid degradation operon negative regulatory protein
MPTDEFITLTAGLRSLGGRRVWSLMISLFGDLAHARVRSIDGPLLSTIMGAMLVKPEAARVALHRLRNDGWITSQKSGRISQHGLTSKGRAESAAASPRIYADPDLDTDGWQLVLSETGTSEQIEVMAARGFISVAARVFVGPMTAKAPQGCVVVSAMDAPDWLRAQAEPQELSESYAALRDILLELQKTLPPPESFSPIEVVVLRCLIVHNWRRLVLKHPALPAPLIDRSGSAHQCHLLVSDLLTRFARPRLSEIEQSSAAA